MSTSIEAKRRRAVGLDSFQHITDVPLAVDGIQPDGLLFDGDLTDEEIGDIWWWVTSVDDGDQAWRLELAALIAEAETKPYNETTKWLTDAFARLARGVVGLGADS